MTKISITLLFLTIFSFSQSLDATFGQNGGIIIKNYSDASSYDVCSNAILQPDGKIVYVGRHNFYRDSFIARTNIDGTLDNTFNFNGIKIVLQEQYLAHLAIQTDGKIVAASSNIIYRFNSDGSADLTFASNGLLYLNSINNLYSIKSIIIQQNGQIVIIRNFNNDFGIVRINANGTFDNSFGVAGITSQSINAGVDNPFAVTLQPDGKILVTGKSINSSNISSIATIRLNPNGALDTTFGNAGIAIYADITNKYGRALDIQSDGKIVVLGTSTTGLFLLRYNSNGTLDTSFDVDGVLNTSILISTSQTLLNFTSNRPNLKILSNGKILISATSADDYCLAQFNTNGTSDTTFGTNGKTLLNYNITDKSSYLLVRPNGKILSGGTSSDNNVTGSFSKILNSELSATGIFESTFNFNVAKTNDRIISIVEQTSGKSVALFETNDSLLGKITKLTRFNIDGSLDLTFGTNGFSESNFETIMKIIVQPDNKILFCDTSNITRYNENGTIDNSFGTNGYTAFEIVDPNPISYIEDFALDSNSKIILAIDIINGSSYSFGVVKLNNNGIIDTTFGVNGFANTRYNIFTTTDIEFPGSIAVQNNNDLIVSGVTYENQSTNRTLAILKYTSNGILDTTFGTNGKYVLQNNDNLFPTKTINLPNNQFLINCSKNINGFVGSSTYKFNNNGTLDNIFGSNGTLNDNFMTNDMSMQTDGKILKSGTKNNQFCTTRYNANGSIYNSFGTAGNLSTLINLYSSINSICTATNNKILVGGYTITNQNKFELAIAKYTNTNLGNLNFSKNKNQILIYPNPIEESALFEYNLQNNENISIEICDMNGKILKTIIENKNINAGNQQQKIDLSDGFAAGNYILKFSNTSGSQSVQIMKK